MACEHERANGGRLNGADLPLDLDRVLPRVQKPVRSIGGEWNAIERQPRFCQAGFIYRQLPWSAASTAPEQPR